MHLEFKPKFSKIIDQGCLNGFQTELTNFNYEADISILTSRPVHCLPGDHHLSTPQNCFLHNYFYSILKKFFYRIILLHLLLRQNISTAINSTSTISISLSYILPKSSIMAMQSSLKVMNKTKRRGIQLRHKFCSLLLINMISINTKWESV